MRVDKLIKDKKIISKKQFASFLKSKKDYNNWTNEEIINEAKNYNWSKKFIKQTQTLKQPNSSNEK